VEYALALIVLAALVAVFVAAPLRRARFEAAERRDAERRADLEAAKEAKYREIRDAEMDFRMGKLSEDDYRATDRELRAQAIEILRRLDSLEGREAGEQEQPSRRSGA
jgi:hypothetical protein